MSVARRYGICPRVTFWYSHTLFVFAIFKHISNSEMVSDFTNSLSLENCQAQLSRNSFLRCLAAAKFGVRGGRLAYAPADHSLVGQYSDFGRCAKCPVLFGDVAATTLMSCQQVPHEARDVELASFIPTSSINVGTSIGACVAGCLAILMKISSTKTRIYQNALKIRNSVGLGGSTTQPSAHAFQLVTNYCQKVCPHE
jgi:hypothetical protein